MVDPGNDPGDTPGDEPATSPRADPGGAPDDLDLDLDDPDHPDAAGQAPPGAAVVSPGLQIERGWRGVVWQIAFPAAVVVLALAVPLVAWVGREALLESRGGRPANTVSDPDVPGFEAAVEPTPTMLIVQLGDGGLTGLTLLAQTGQTTGSVLFIPVDTAVPAEELDLDSEPPGEAAGSEDPAGEDPSGEDPVADGTTTTSATADAPRTGPLPLSDVYELGGTNAVTTGVEVLLGIGIGERTIEIEGDDDGRRAGDTGVEEVTVDRWGELVAPIAPLTVSNLDPVVVEDGGEQRELFPGGELTLEAGDVGRYVEALGPDESELNRTVRNQSFWLAWLEAIGRSDDPGAVPGEIDVGLGGFVRALALRTVRFYTVPVTTLRIPDTADEVFVANEEELAQMMVEIVPFPVGSDADPRPRVRVLDGTGTAGASLAAADVLVRAGAEIVLIGNASDFDHIETDILYYDPALEETAQRFSEALGGAETAFADEPGEVVEVTVVVGREFVDSADLDSGGLSVEPAQDGDDDGG